MDPFLPLVSIVIPVYNGQDFLAEAIESALAQTYPHIEILVVNDGSTDGGATETIALRYGERIRYFSKPNGGVATALNLAIQRMEGSYFSWLSHDDLYTPEKIQHQVTYLRSLPPLERARAVVYSDYSLFTTDAEKAVPVASKAVVPAAFRFGIIGTNIVHGCALLIPKEAFAEVGVFDPALKTTQDYDLWFRMAAAYAFHPAPGYVVKARAHANQGTVAMAGLAMQEAEALCLGFLTTITQQEITAATGKPLAISYAMMAKTMWYRGFIRAGKRANDLALTQLKHSDAETILLTLGIMAKGYCLYFLFTHIRPHISPYMRQKIRQQLARVKQALKNEVEDLRSLFVKVAPPPAPQMSAELSGLELQEKFSRVYADNMFLGAHSRSGEGSDLVQTQVIRETIPQLLREFHIRSMLDAPCGDWYWMQHVEKPIESYIGLDIVPALIAKNQQQFGNDVVSFQQANLAETPLPKADLILSRDCLVHLSFADALRILHNFKRSGATYLLTTTFTDRTVNHDLDETFWRPLNKQLAPFHFPPPLRLINERCTEGGNEFADKCLGLWLLDDIPWPNIA